MGCKLKGAALQRELEILMFGSGEHFSELASININDEVIVLCVVHEYCFVHLYCFA